MRKCTLLLIATMLLLPTQLTAQTTEGYITNNLGRIVEVANSGGALTTPHLLIGYDSTGLVYHSNSLNAFKIFATFPNTTNLQNLNTQNRFGAPSANDCYEIRFGNDSSRYWINTGVAGNGGNRALNRLPFSVYHVGPRSSVNPSVTGGTKLCIKITDKDSNGIYSPGEQIFVLADLANPLDSTYDSLSHRTVNPFPSNRSVITGLRFGQASIPYDQTTFSVPWDGITPAAGTVVRLVARTADTIPPVIFLENNVEAPLVGSSNRIPIPVYSYQTPIFFLENEPGGMTLSHDTIIWTITNSQLGQSYHFRIKAVHNAGTCYRICTGYAGYQNSAVQVHLTNNQIDYHTRNDGSIAYNAVANNYGMGWINDIAQLFYASGFYIAGKKIGMNGDPDTINVTNVEFESEWGAGRILNQGPFGDLIVEDRTSPTAKVFVLPEHYSIWPSEAPHDSLGQPMKLSARDTWTVFNDVWAKTLSNDSTSLSPSFGIECQRQTFQFLEYPFNSAVIVRMRMINKSDATYDSCYFGLWADPDVGMDAGDDLSTIDTILPCLVTYSNTDISTSASGLYLIQKPLLTCDSCDSGQSVTINQFGFQKLILSNKQESYPSAAISYNPNFSDIPWWNDISRFNILKGFDVLGFPKTNGRFDLTFFGSLAGDQRVIMGVGPFTFTAGDTQEVWYALMGAKGTTKANAVDSILNHAYLMKEIFYSDMNRMIVGVNDPVNPVPQRVILSPNYPNPFNPATTIRYELKQNSKVSLKIYNILGQEVKTLVNKQNSSGIHSILWDGKNNHGQRVTSGVYFYRLEAGEFVKTRKMVLVK